MPASRSLPHSFQCPESGQAEGLTSSCIIYMPYAGIKAFERFLVWLPIRDGGSMIHLIDEVITAPPNGQKTCISFVYSRKFIVVSSVDEV